MSDQTSAEGPGLSQKLVQVDPQIFRRIDKALFGSSKLSDGARTWRARPPRSAVIASASESLRVRPINE
jgi:hypothetical protein